MEKKIFGLKDKASGLLDKAKEKAVNVIDQDGDGQFDMKDVSIIKNGIGDAAKKAKDATKDYIDQKNREKELNELQPIFEEDIDDSDFYMSRLVRITEMDKRRMDSDLCKGSVGYMSSDKGFDVVNIYQDSVDKFGVSFYPDTTCEVYYVDPTDRDRYIALDEYFSYLKMSRVTELQKIAQDLGAKHFRILYKERKATLSSKKSKSKIGVKGASDADASMEKESESSDLVTIEIAAEASFPGHAPVEPKIKYLKRDPSIKALVDSRMDATSPLCHQKYTVDFSTTSGIREKDAHRIDAFLKGLKINGESTVVSEVQRESRRFFEYEIEF